LLIWLIGYFLVANRIDKIGVKQPDWSIWRIIFKNFLVFLLKLKFLGYAYSKNVVIILWSINKRPSNLKLWYRLLNLIPASAVMNY
jgi:hypothetical protein